MILANISDLREAARRRLPHALFDFIDGGAQDEVTLRANQEDFHQLALLPRVLTEFPSAINRSPCSDTSSRNH